jgi:HAD superfamily hydrolase (TIGR01509 family)
VKEIATPRAVLFDLDGVLVDSYDAWFLVVNDAAKRFGAPAIDAEKFRSVWGQGVSADVKNLYPGRTHAEVEAAYTDALPRRRDKVRVNPEAAATLDALAARDVARSVVTNTQEGLAREVLRAASLLSRIDVLVGVVEGRKEKPAPDLLLLAAAKLGVPPRRALMVGDSRYDEEAAAAARVPFLHYDQRTGASLLAAVLARVEPTRTAESKEP